MKTILQRAIEREQGRIKTYKENNENPIKIRMSDALIKAAEKEILMISKEETRVERDIEIVEMLENEISIAQDMNYLGSQDTKIDVLKEIKEWIEENK